MVMREPAFLKQNKDKWLQYESELSEDTPDPSADRLAELYVQLTDDLAYARTFYPRSKIIKYLNGLASRVHLIIYHNKKEKKKRLGSFWTHELPIINWEARRFYFYSFLIFTLSFLIGLISSIQDQDFVRMILGDQYVNMTIENIRKGDPLGVYRSMPEWEMFFVIAFNNLLVMLQIYAMGITFSIGTIIGFPGWVSGIFQNGVMVGAFLGFFHQFNLFWEAIPIVYIHGTLELSALVLGGGAGLMLGNSLLFPKTYTRLQSLRRAAPKSLKMMIGLVPIIIMAAFFEAFLTRLTEMPLFLKLLIIFFSLSLILGYYILYPYYLVHRQQHMVNPNTSVIHQ